MRIGILGSGLMGGKLGTLFGRARHDVVFSYARSTEKLKRLANDAKGNARAGTPREAAQEADALLLAVHWSRMDDVLSKTGDLSGKVIVSCSLPMNAQHRTHPRPHLLGFGGTCKETSKGSLRFQHRAQRSAFWRLRGSPQSRETQPRVLRG
jgi:predicted dinucleotide-binding enzyme